jgi:hypothetical protein
MAKTSGTNSSKGGLVSQNVSSPPGLPRQDFRERQSMPRMAPHPSSRGLEAKGSMRNTDSGMASKQTLSNRRPPDSRGSGDQS